MMYREVAGLIAEEDDKISAVHSELFSERDQINQERKSIAKREEELQEQVVNVIKYFFVQYFDWWPVFEFF